MVLGIAKRLLVGRPVHSDHLGRQNVHAYPSGGGDYEVTSTNLGRRVSMLVASALMVDYTLTVAVSVSAGPWDSCCCAPSPPAARP